LINGGRDIIYSATDGSGGFENEGQSLRIYNVSTGKTRKILSEYYLVDKVKEVKLSNGKVALLVKMSDGGLGASYFAVVDPNRGEVFSRQLARLKKQAGDYITLEFFSREDWGVLAEGSNEEKRKVKPSKTERHDLKKLLKRRVIYNKRDR
jgi:hypothetical protein